MMLTKLETSARVGLSVATLWRMAKRGQFPQLVKLTERRVGWESTEVEAWLAARERLGGPAPEPAAAER